MASVLLNLVTIHAMFLITEQSNKSVMGVQKMSKNLTDLKNQAKNCFGSGCSKSYGRVDGTINYIEQLLKKLNNYKNERQNKNFDGDDESEQKYEKRKTRYNDKRQYYNNPQEHSYKLRGYDDRRQTQEIGRQKYIDRRQTADVKRHEYDNRRLENDYIGQNYDNRKQVDRRQKYHETQKYGRKQEYQRYREDNDDDEDIIDQALQITDNKYRSKNDFDTVKLNPLSLKAVTKERHHSSINLEDFVMYYEKIKAEMTDALLKYVKGLGDRSYLSKLLPYQKKQVELLKNNQYQTPLTDNKLKSKIIQLLFGTLSNIKILPHSKDDYAIYIPQRVYDAIPSFKKNNALRLKKRIFPLTYHQKQRQRNKVPKRIIVKHSWRRNNQDLPQYGVPFILEVQGLGQLN